MKWFIFSIILILSIFSCKQMDWSMYPEMNMPLDEAWQIVSKIEYSVYNEEYIKSPMETKNDEFGDCEDFAIYLMYLLGADSKLICINLNGTVHYIVYYDGKYIEPQCYNIYYSQDYISTIKIREYSYIKTMKLATNYGTKNL